MKKILILLSVLMLFIADSTIAGKYDHETKKIEVEDAKKLVIEGEFSTGEFTIIPEDINEAAIVDIDYNPRYIDYDVDYEEKGSTGYMYFESTNRRKNNINTEDNIWDIVLSTRYTTSLDFEVGACDADFDLGGIPLTEFTMDLGAASAVIVFSEPNPERMKEISIDAGACSLEMESIGNSNFEEFNFSGGVGSFDLDFRGEYQGESIIDIDIGLGSADIILPRDIPVRIETDGDNWFSSVDFDDDDLDEIDDDVYESPGFEKTETRIVIHISVGMGSIDIDWKK